ncbi:MAG: hypothetical protein EOO62_03830 [Hymenobacter sp.]|nr:MAG: hypothetical protein EOO62_03830 [Hymenobacter sp.]
MNQDYSPLLVSCPAHLARFGEIKQQNPWWRMLLGLHKIPEGFPRAYVGGNAVPVNFFAKGSLHLGEQQFTFASRDPGFDNGQRYAHITPDFHFDLPYASLTRVERYEPPAAYIKYFNLNWVRIQLSAPNAPDDLLLSCTGSGTEMSLIHQGNELLYNELQAKLRQGSRAAPGV